MNTVTQNYGKSHHQDPINSLHERTMKQQIHKNPSSGLVFHGETQKNGAYRYTSDEDVSNSKKSQATAILEVLEILRSSTRGTKHQNNSDGTTRAEVVIDDKNKKILISPLPRKPSLQKAESRSQEQSPASSTISTSSSRGMEPKGLLAFGRKERRRKARGTAPSSSATAPSMDAATIRRRNSSFERRLSKQSKGGRSESVPPRMAIDKGKASLDDDSNHTFTQEADASLGDFHVQEENFCNTRKPKKSLDRKIKKDKSKNRQKFVPDWSVTDTSNSSGRLDTYNKSSASSDPFPAHQRVLPLSKSNLQKVTTTRTVASERGARTIMSVKPPRRMSASQTGSTISAASKGSDGRPSISRSSSKTWSTVRMPEADSSVHERTLFNTPPKPKRVIKVAPIPPPLLHDSFIPPPKTVAKAPLEEDIVPAWKIAEDMDITMTRSNRSNKDIPPLEDFSPISKEEKSFCFSSKPPSPPRVGLKDKFAGDDSFDTTDTEDLSSLESSSQHSSENNSESNIDNDAIDYQDSQSSLPAITEVPSAGGRVRNRKTNEEYTGFFLLDGDSGNNRKHGYGRTKYADGRIFEGTYDHGVMVEGRMTYPEEKCPTTGNIFQPTYVGKFDSHGLKTGKGIYTTSTATFLGDFQNDQMHGSGILIYTDTDDELVTEREDTTASDDPQPKTNKSCHGRRLVGHWKEGLRHGYGKELRVDGSVQREGYWRDRKSVV